MLRKKVEPILVYPTRDMLRHTFQDQINNVADMPSESQLLMEITREYWQAFLTNEPVYATSLGDRRYDDKLPDKSPEGLTRVEKQYTLFLERTKQINGNNLSVSDSLTLIALKVELESQLDYLRCHLEEWVIDPLSGPQIELQNLESYQPVRTIAEGRAMVKRWGAMAQFLNNHIANLRRGLVQGKVAVRAAVENVIDETQSLLAKPDEDWPLLRPLSASHDDWTTQEREEFRGGLRDAVRSKVRPALASYVQFLGAELLPRSRSENMPGICHISGGLESYKRLIRAHTSLNLTTDELHQTGLREVRRINVEMEALGAKVFGIGGRKETLQRLRTDSSLYFATREEVARKAEEALARAKAAMPRWFGRLPKTDCVVVRMSEHEEEHSTIAYYRQPATDGSRPGQYYINTSHPETRPRYEAEVLAYHESIPGHHLQIAIAAELEGLPDFRRYNGVTSFVEGWGLYTERLADEMNLYSSDLDRIGVLSYDAWRACRLVVDTGMHANQWTRQQAIDYMIENTALAKNNIINEVDRYITWPAQALAYKTGQLEILRLREEAKHKLGAKFDTREFHDAVLSNGALPLEALRQTVADYSAKR
jgi:uncharacterized protein (DUF885 family)